MTPTRLFFAILGFSFCGLFAATLVPAALKPANRSWQLFVCNGPGCPAGWSTAVMSHAFPKADEPAHKQKLHSA